MSRCRRLAKPATLLGPMPRPDCDETCSVLISGTELAASASAGGSLVRLLFRAGHFACMCRRATLTIPSLWRGCFHNFFCVGPGRWRCKRPFDVSGRSCGRCEAHLPAAFFYQNSISCISCAREYHRHKSEGIVVPAPPAQKQCTRCHRTWSAIISSCTAPFLMIMLQS